MYIFLTYSRNSNPKGYILRYHQPSYMSLKNLLALFVGQRLCINFFISRVNFLIILDSHLDIMYFVIF